MYTYKYPHPSVTTDCVIFGYDGKDLHLLLVERGSDPYKGSWALPGGFMEINETVEECAARELFEETHVKDLYLEQFHTFSDVHRDPRERVLTVAFYALVRKSDYLVMAGDDARKATWFPVKNLPSLAFDHEKIISMAQERLREKVCYQPLAFRLLDEFFSLEELQRLYEAINGTRYDCLDFQKKIKATGFLEERGAREEIGLEESCLIYRFNEKAYEESMKQAATQKFPFCF